MAALESFGSRLGSNQELLRKGICAIESRASKNHQDIRLLCANLRSAAGLLGTALANLDRFKLKVVTDMDSLYIAFHFVVRQSAERH